MHQNRLAQMAREGANADAAHLREFEDERRYATLVAVVLDAMATLTDEALAMHERLIGRAFKKAERRHLEAFQRQGKAINEKVRLYATVGRALIEAVYDRARGAGSARVYWQTHETNATARALYDKVAAHYGFLVYRKDV